MPIAGRLGRGHQPQRQLGHHRKGALAAAQQAPQVIAGDVLHEPPAAANDLTRRQHRLDAEHVVARDPILQRAQAARALRHVPADRRSRLAPGSGGNRRPFAAAACASSIVRTPGSQTATSSAPLTSLTLFIRVSTSTMPPRCANRPGAQIRARPARNDRDPAARWRAAARRRPPRPSPGTRPHQDDRAQAASRPSRK